MRKIKRKKGYAGKMQEKIFEQIRMNEIIEKKKKSDIKLKSLMSTGTAWKRIPQPLYEMRKGIRP